MSATASAHKVLFTAETQAQLVAGLDEDGRARVDKAVQWLRDAQPDTTLDTGEPLAVHCAGAAVILAQLGADAPTRASSLLSALAPDKKNLEALHTGFGADVVALVQGVHALLKLDQATNKQRHQQQGNQPDQQQTEMRRKMMLAMAADLRIVLLRLASRLQSLRWYAQSKTTCPPDYAQQTLDVHTPLANRLGIWQLKWEMEDLSFRVLQPEVYRRIARQLEDKRTERQELIASLVAQLQQALQQAGIAAQVSGRPKHIYSIWNKMRHKQLDFEQLFDLRALRVIVEDERACYAALALVHALWTPLSEEFDDYIARPKPNGYRSLHTVVADVRGRSFEIQIRTRDMHTFAEYGLAAHWRYKESTGAPNNQGGSDYDKKIAWMRRLLAWEHGEKAGAENEPAPHLADEPIYVMTPQARVIELPARATPVDFAYAIHTDLGHRCRGARVDGQMVPLLTQLKTGQMVEIISAKSGAPSRDWLNPQSGYLASHRARVKVRAWFNARQLQARREQGQALIERELQRLGKISVNREHLAQQLGFDSADDLYSAAARDEFSLRLVGLTLQQLGAGAPVDADKQASDEALFAPRGDKPAASSNQHSGGSVRVMGVDDLMTQLAHCCRPAPPDVIGGFVTRGRGVSVHRQQCSNYQTLVKLHPERAIAVDWGSAHTAAADTAADAEDSLAVYPVDLSIHAQQSPNVLRELSEVFSRLRVNVISVNTHSRGSLAHMVFTVQVRNGAQIAQVLTALNALESVSARRK